MAAEEGVAIEPAVDLNETMISMVNADDKQRIETLTQQIMELQDMHV